MIVDTHVHVIARDAARYPLRPSGVGSEWFRDHPVSAEQFAMTATAAGVDRAVLVQAFGAYGTDNDYVVDAVSVAPERFVSVGIVDAADPGAPSTLRALAGRPGFSGLRLFAIGASPPTWLDDPRTEPLWAVATELDLRIVVALLPPDLPRLRRRLEQSPGVPVVLDHCGFPDLAGGPPYPRAAALFALAEFEHLHLKVTSHLLEAADAVGDPCGQVLVELLAAAFGASRLVWGSDYPQTHDRSYAELVELGRAACARLSEADCARVMGGNAVRLWPALDR
jgi:predicted TIM-barrel fold metal-dependent hydrolase